MAYSLDTALYMRHELSNKRPIIRAGHWSIEKPDCDPYRGPEYEVWHYGTRMFHWVEYDRGNPGELGILHMSLGHGSVSDQQGMNRVFRILDLPLYFSRAGGAKIEWVDIDTGERTLML